MSQEQLASINEMYEEEQDIVFVAGAYGMVGSAICRKLEQRYKKRVLKPSRKEIDLTDYKLVSDYIASEKPKSVILSAAKVGGIESNRKNPGDYILNNLEIQTNVIASAWRNKVENFIFIGSSCIYPKYAQQPIREEELLTGLLEPTNEAYAIAKIAGIKLCQSLKKQYGFNAVSLMPTNLYGQGDRFNLKESHVIPSLVMRFDEAKRQNAEEVTLWGTGTPFREFLHVDDLGDACVHILDLMDKNQSKSEKSQRTSIPDIINVGTGVDLRISQLADIIKDIVGYKGKIKWDTSMPDGTPKKQLCIDKIEKLGWCPKINLEEGLKAYYDLYQDAIKTNSVRR